MEIQKPQQYTGIITKKLQLTKTVYHFVIQNENPKELLFTPGQYATFLIDEKIRRLYSFCSAPDLHQFELVVDVSPMGPGSLYFLNKKVGDTVEYLAPFGNFQLTDSPLKKIFIATGTGIAPFRSMLWNEMEILNSKSEILNNVQNFNNQNIKNNLKSPSSVLRPPSISLYWGLRYEDDVYWDEELRALSGQYTGFQYFLVLSKPGEKWQGLRGHVTDYVFEIPAFAKASAGKEKDLQYCEFYLCGNSAMISEMKQRLSDINVPEERVKIDIFY